MMENLISLKSASFSSVIRESMPSGITTVESPSEIADDIAINFFPVASLSHADLRRHIIKAIEDEREVTKHYMTQIGRWWSNSIKSSTIGSYRRAKGGFQLKKGETPEDVIREARDV